MRNTRGMRRGRSRTTRRSTVRRRRTRETKIVAQ
jgi:hypothetical protein